jgi:hypothetical protein
MPMALAGATMDSSDPAPGSPIIVGSPNPPKSLPC